MVRCLRHSNVILDSLVPLLIVLCFLRLSRGKTTVLATLKHCTRTARIHLIYRQRVEIAGNLVLSSSHRRHNAYFERALFAFEYNEEKLSLISRVLSAEDADSAVRVCSHSHLMQSGPIRKGVQT